MEIKMSRKDDHVTLATKHYSKEINDFDRVRFIHQNFSELSISDIELSTSIDSLSLEVPFFINAMTGGSKLTKTINEKLAQVAKATNLAMASGSMSMALKDVTTLDSFQIIRQVNPKGVVMVNLQASATVEQAKQVIDWMQANAIQLHVNVAQEIIMAEGDRRFHHWLENIENIIQACPIPVIVKEVGFGFSKQAIEKCEKIGVKIIDISGKGGTNFAKIENIRNEKLMDYMNDWGQSSVCSLLEAQDVKTMDIVASGGVRNMLDVAKALALGAKAVGISGTMLHLVQTVGVHEAIEVVDSFKEQLKQIMVLLNVKSVEDFKHTDLIFDETIERYARQRDLDLTRYHHRVDRK